MTQQMLSASGTEKCELIIQDGLEILYSETFLIYVEPNVQDGSFLESFNECDVIVETLNKVSEYEKQTKNKKDEVNQIALDVTDTKENIDETYADLQQAVTQTNDLIEANEAINANEVERIAAENTRVENEATRQTNTINAIENAEAATERANNAAKNCEDIAEGTGFIKSSEKGQANGIAELNENGFVLASQLPSFVDDVMEGYLYDNTFYKDSSHTTEIMPEAGKIYIDLTDDINKTYRWSGAKFVLISDTIALGETSSTAYRGDRGKIAYDHAQAQHAPSNAQKNVQADWSETNSSSDSYIKNKPSTVNTKEEITAKSINLTSTSAPGSTDNVYSIRTAPNSGEHLCIGKNRIQAFNNGNTGKLYLNYYGGDISIGQDSKCLKISIGSENTEVIINGKPYDNTPHVITLRPTADLIGLSTSAKKFSGYSLVDGFEYSNFFNFLSNSGDINIVKAGTYLVSAQIYFMNDFTVNDIVHAVLYKNNTAITETQCRLTTGGPYICLALAPYTISCSADDKLSIQCYNQTEARGNIGANKTHVAIQKL